MIETIEVTIDGKKYTYNKGITVEEVLIEHGDKTKYPVIIARADNKLKELSDKLHHSCTLELLDLTSPEGNRVHINTLILILLSAINVLYGNNAKIKVEHSLDKGMYIKTKFRLTEEKLDAIKEKMKEIIKKDLPIAKLNIDRLEAIKYYEEIGEDSKAGVLKYNTDNYITLYRLGNVYDYFYSLMPPSTAKAKDFDLTYLNDKSFVLRFPTVYISDKIKKYEHHPHIFDVFEQYKKWADLIDIKTSVDLNRVVTTGKIGDLIKMDETVQTHRLLTVAKEIYDNKDRIKIVLLAGPSSSGKTTTSKKLCIYLNILGLHPVAVEMDNYFVDRKDTPKDENGKYDFECLEAVDLDLFDKQMKQLINGEDVEVPTYNFGSGKKEFKSHMKLAENEIIIIEGIHALDPKILTNIQREKKYKLYISPLTQLRMDDHNRIPTTDNRVLRRIVRDNRTRNYTVEDTLAQWASVRNGEEKYIFPYQDESDAMINSASIYEIGVLKTYVEPLLYSVSSDSPYYEEAKRLINELRLFLPIPSESIPEDAILREFIGGSYFSKN
ncbi:MAG: nucleoside kinase [Bacilli bacterium]|nr:nucleoside kinase [Bacilli bacterium]